MLVDLPRDLIDDLLALRDDATSYHHDLCETFADGSCLCQKAIQEPLRRLGDAVDSVDTAALQPGASRSAAARAALRSVT